MDNDEVQMLRSQKMNHFIIMAQLVLLFVMSGESLLKNFLSDMGVRPSGMTIDRIDNSKGYFKENCRWQTPKEQANNRRSNIVVYNNGNKLTVEEYAN